MKPDDIPFNELYRTGAPQEAIGEIRRALEFVELDAVSALYDESLHLAREGHLGRSRDRLRVLLCLNPDDAGAHLLLAKVFASQRSWGPAIAELDAAAACGARLPVSMKDAFIEHRDQEQLRTEVVPSGALSARAEGELLALREEVRRMRSERARANRKVNDLEQRSQLWSIATGVVTGVSALALLLVTLSWPDGAQDISLDPGGEAVASLDSIDRAPAVGTSTVDRAPATKVVRTTSRKSSVKKAVDKAADATPRKTIAQKTSTVVTTATKASAKPAAGGAYTVGKGDSLWKIAGKVYGDKARWEEIRDANKKLFEEGIDLQVGMTLRIP